MITDLSVVYRERAVETRDIDNSCSLSSIELCFKEEIPWESRVINCNVLTEFYPDHAFQIIFGVRQRDKWSNSELCLIMVELCKCQVILCDTGTCRVIQEAEFLNAHSNEPFHCILTILGKILPKHFNPWNATEFDYALTVTTIVTEIPISPDFNLLWIDRHITSCVNGKRL